MKYLKKSHADIVNNKDIVARLPLLGVYRHVGELVFIDGDGIIQVMPFDGGRRDDPTEFGANRGATENRQADITGSGFVPVAFGDHGPLLYAFRLRNNLIRA